MNNQNMIKRLFSLSAVVLLLTGNVMYAQQYRVQVDVTKQEPIQLSNVLSSFSFEELSSDELLKIQDNVHRMELNKYFPSIVNKKNYLSNPLDNSYINKFVEKRDSVIIHFVPSDTILILDKRTRKISPWIVIDFGEKGYKDNLSLLSNEMYKKYVTSHYKYAGYIENVALFDSVLFFTYRYNDEIVQVLFNMATNHCLNGKIVDDLFSQFSNATLFNQAVSKVDRGIDIGYLMSFNLSNPMIKELFPKVDVDSIKFVNKNNFNRMVLIPTFKNF